MLSNVDCSFGLKLPPIHVGLYWSANAKNVIGSRQVVKFHVWVLIMTVFIRNNTSGVKYGENNCPVDDGLSTHCEKLATGWDIWKLAEQIWICNRNSQISDLNSTQVNAYLSNFADNKTVNQREIISPSLKHKYYYFILYRKTKTGKNSNWTWNITPQNGRVPLKRTSGLTANKTTKTQCPWQVVCMNSFSFMSRTFSRSKLNNFINSFTTGVVTEF